jgi:ribonuclease G
MYSEIIVNTTKEETRVALMESGQLAELFIERKKDTSLIGNIYKGRVIRVLPGMQSAFVDIGLSKAAFLYVRDVFSGLNTSIFGEDLEEYSEPLGYPIEEILQEGEEILLQVSKDPIGSKGARGTSYITLPGRFLVLMPGLDHIGISRRIQNEQERLRLKELIEGMKPEGYGFIARTASESCQEDELRKDMDFLTRLWSNIQKKKEHSSSPLLLYSDLDLITRSVRDLFSNDVSRLVIDNKKEYENLLDFVDTYFPKLSKKIFLYDDYEPIFEAFGIELEIKRALGRRVWLKSGGYIVIDQTEALTSIDVNTGKYVGKESLEETIMSTNLEAVKEIAYQIRLRNLGGIIIVDFIDMEKEENRKKLLQAFQEAMSKDRAKTTILQVSDLGLIEMTRKRVRESLGRTLCELCPYCEGRGFVKSPTSICYEIFRELRKIGLKKRDVKVVINAHTSVSDLLYDEEREGLEELERLYNFKVIIKSDKDHHQENFEFTIL